MSNPCERREKTIEGTNERAPSFSSLRAIRNVSMNANRATLRITLPASLEVATRDLASKRRVSMADLVRSALHEYLYSSRNRMYQVSTSAALVEGIHSGS